MEIIVPHRIRKRELDGTIPDEARKLFDKLKDKPGLAETISARGLPASTTLHKVYATTEGGARRLLFFCRHAPSGPGAAPERWVLLFYRDKSDAVGRNMTHKNPEFVAELGKNLQAALADIAASTPQDLRFDSF
ncbi:MAG: hypothetical protein RIQ79_846 [Verrucomicrobiota bacterium]